MKRIATSQLIPGMIAAEDIFSYNNQLLIPKNTELTDAAITILGMYDIVSIRVEDTIVEVPADSAETIDLSRPYSERIKNSPTFQLFQKNYAHELAHFKETVVKSVEQRIRFDSDELIDGILSLVGIVNTGSGIFDMLSCMKEYDDSTFAHCINVALITNVAARWLGLSEEDIHTATVAGLFHDIGKLQIPKSILSKPDRLTSDEYAVIKAHPITGFQLLQEQGAPMDVCEAALMHHERCDGGGYPFHRSREEINRFAKLVAIADVYDAMTASRVYRGPLCPFLVIALFEREGLTQYEPRYIMTFLENVVNTYIQNRCLLSNGQEGTIIFINRDKLSRPMVQCNTECINLAERADLKITCLL